MNDKIKELALENVQQLDWEPPAEPKEYTFTAEGLNKFAELIVKECALIAGLMEIQNRKNIGAALLDRFGVKE